MYQKIILASGSPRRRELFTKLGINFQYTTSTIKENLDEKIPPEKLVMKIATMKAYNVSNVYTEAFIIGADTVIYFEDNIIGKPGDENDARQTLKMLSGKKHEVYTGVAIVNKNENVCERLFQKTEVYFKKLSDPLIDWYISSEEPMDKAGSYGIQGKGSLLVEKIVGDYDNVVGLPVGKVMESFTRLNLAPFGGFSHEIQ